MTKAQLQARLECQQARCKYYHRCTIYWGRRCTRQGGRKVPRLRMCHVYNDFDLAGYADVATMKNF